MKDKFVASKDLFHAATHANAVLESLSVFWISESFVNEDIAFKL